MRSVTMPGVTRRGFTLIELLVVIAIIAILAAILFPVFAKVRRTAKQTTCTAHVRQMGMALSQYADDNNEMMPPGFRRQIYRNDPIGWENNVYHYAKSWDIFKCPEVNAMHSYIRNEWAGEAQLTQKGDPSKVIHLFDFPVYPEKGVFRGWNASIRNYDDADFSNDTQYNHGDSTATVTRNTSFDVQGYPWWMRFPGPHNGKTVILFLDGHVSAYSAWDPNKMTFEWAPILKYH